MAVRIAGQIKPDGPIWIDARTGSVNELTELTGESWKKVVPEGFEVYVKSVSSWYIFVPNSSHLETTGYFRPRNQYTDQAIERLQAGIDTKITDLSNQINTKFTEISSKITNVLQKVSGIHRSVSTFDDLLTVDSPSLGESVCVSTTGELYAFLGTDSTEQSSWRKLIISSDVLGLDNDPNPNKTLSKAKIESEYQTISASETVARDLISRVNRIESTNIKMKGYFRTSTVLMQKWPTPLVGDIAYVGEPYPGKLWICETAGVWVPTVDSPSSPIGTVNFDDFLLKSKIVFLTPQEYEALGPGSLDPEVYYCIYEEG